MGFSHGIVVTEPVTLRQGPSLTALDTGQEADSMYVARMVTKIYPRRARRLFIREWQDHFQLSAETMAARLGIERESYYRLLREPHRINLARLEQLADAMGHNLEPQDFYRPPTRPSLDALVEGAPPELRQTAVDIVRRLIGKAS